MAGCAPARKLADNERLLYKIRLEGVEQNPSESIEALYQQRPNRKLFGLMPYLSIYNFGKKFYNPENIQKRIARERAQFDRKVAHAADDSSKVSRLLLKKERKLARLSRRLEEGNVLMAFGEPPVIYDSVKTNKTIQQINTYLHAKGYFRGRSSYQLAEKGKKIRLTYRVVENKPYTYSLVTDSISDPAIKRLVDSTRHESLVKPGQNYDESVLVNERDRLERLLKNKGYFQFQKKYITAHVDTSFEQNQVRLQMSIANEADGSPHQPFRIGKVLYTGDADRPRRFGVNRDTILYNNLYYLAYRHRLSPRILDKKISIRPGQLYSFDQTISTQQQLLNLNMFRFLNISYTPQDSILIANIAASPNRRFQETTELGASYSATLLGPFANLRLTVRNIFGGAELLEMGIRGGLEGQYSLKEDDEPVFTKELSANVGLLFPQFLIPFRTNQYFTRYNPRTRINLVYTYIDRQEFKRTNQELTFDYIWQKNPRLQFVFTPFDITFNKSREIDPGFKQQLINARINPDFETTYEKSFNDYFVTSLNFSALYNSNNYNQSLDATYFRFFVEEAGILGSVLFNNTFLDKNSKLFKYARISADYRRYFKLSRTNFFVSRVNIGVAKPLGESEALPFDRYYYAGGGTSVRAFRPRRLGPGSYFLQAKDRDGNPIFYDGRIPQRDENIEQPGELLLEGNLEYRFNIFSFWNGAVFADAGNVWMLSEDPNRPGSQFQLNQFYKQFGVGAGFGFRFDFTFLIARVDLATRIYDPTEPDPRNRFVPGTYDFSYLLKNKTVLNLGIGYPF